MPSILTRVLQKISEALKKLPNERKATINEGDENVNVSIQMSLRKNKCHIRMTITCPTCKAEHALRCGLTCIARH